jgi:two-component system, chemotaxis family, sensor kinase CheA
LYLNYIHQEESLLTKLKSTNEKELLLMKGEELRHLIGNVAHDLKSPLHGFSLELETLRKRLHATQDLESMESIVALRRICSFLLMTINRAIDYSKVSSGMLLVPSLETVNLNEILTWVVKCVSPLNELPIRVEPLPVSMCGSVITDKHWLMENLLCLVSNAQKFTGEGSITLRCAFDLTPTSDRNVEQKLLLNQLSSGMIRIEVEDSGSGTHPEERAELFQPFKQAQRRVGGTGLGLYSLLKRVEALGGVCGVSNRRDGETGSLFWFNFPYRPDESATAVMSHRVFDETESLKSIDNVDTTDLTNIESNGEVSKTLKSNNSTLPLNLEDLKTPSAASPPSSRSKPENKKENRRILLVEDSVLIQKTTSRALTNEGYVVDIARNGLECLEMVKQHDYGFILMDIQMPVMDGIEATKRLREMEKSVMGQDETKEDESASEIFQEFETSPIVKSLLVSVGSKCDIPRKYIIIGLSASSDHLTMEEALHAGMNEFLSKPLSVSHLKICFQRFLPHGQQQSMDTT